MMEHDAPIQKEVLQKACLFVCLVRGKNNVN